MTAQPQPTTEWQHSHALTEGDELNTEHGERWRVTTVEDDGTVRVRRLDDGRRGPNDRDAWSEEAVRHSLSNGELERVSDGKSHELATY